MAIDWVVLAATAGAGILGGVASSAISSVIGRASIRRTAAVEKENTKKIIDDCLAKNKAKMRNKLFERNKDCFSCNRLIPKNAAFCAFCGIPVAGTKKCEKCGSDSRLWRLRHHRCHAPPW